MIALYLLAAKTAQQPAKSSSLAGSHYFVSLLAVLALIMLGLVIAVSIVSVAVKMLLAIRRTEKKRNCPGCGSIRVRVSQTRSALMDFLAAMFGCGPFRCRACRHRFYARRVSAAAADAKLAAE